MSHKPGDWNCPVCGDLQFARNRVCRKCGGGRPVESPPAASKDGGSHIYALRLHGGYYYVGQTARPVDDRLVEHLTGAGSAWTRLHGVESVEFVTPGDGWEELRATVELMRTHGIEHVRGGPFCTVELTAEDYAHIQTLLDTTGNACYDCHEMGHMARECPQRATRGGKRPAPHRAPQEERPAKRQRPPDNDPFMPGCAIM